MSIINLGFVLAISITTNIYSQFFLHFIKIMTTSLVENVNSLSSSVYILMFSYWINIHKFSLYTNLNKSMQCVQN